MLQFLLKAGMTSQDAAQVVKEAEAPNLEAPNPPKEAARSPKEAEISKEAARPPKTEAEVEGSSQDPHQQQPNRFSTPLQAEPPRRQAGPSMDSQATAFQVMLRFMEGMQAMQKKFMEGRDEDREHGTEFVRGNPTLPSLVEWNPTTGPIDLNDWISLIEPVMSDLTGSSHEWWKLLMEESTEWYHEHLRLQPLERIKHSPKPSSDLAKPRWARLEKRASTMLLMVVPETQREEMISSKRLSAMAIMCQLLVSYKPGGLAEKELILRSLEVPPESSTLSEAIQALRKWGR